MLARLRRIYRRYHDFHVRMRGPALSVRASGGRLVGGIDRVVKSSDGCTVEGWTTQRDVTFRSGDAETRLTPDLARGDAIAATGDQGARGFAIHLPDWPQAMDFGSGDEGVGVTYPGPGLRHLLAAHIRVGTRFMRDALKAAPAIAAFAVRPTDARRARVVAGLRLNGKGADSILDTRILSAPPADPLPPDYWVIVPVFNAAELVSECLRRVEENAHGTWRALLIDDASTDPKIPGLLSGFERRNPGRVSVMRNPTNLGFLKSVNRGLDALAPFRDPVVLLNTDAMVPPGWDRRLLAPLSRARVASVTPMSNNAEIFSAPDPTDPAQIDPSDVDGIDRIARGLGDLPTTPVPTGVGFCMAMSPRWLARIPRFDEAFGRGYGEEVDWCRKAIALGGEHVVQPRLFVGHVGSVSFGAAERRRRVAQASAVIAQRYPPYDAEVQHFIKTDPLASARFVIGLGWAQATARSPVSVFIAHSMGGGAEIALQREVDDITRTGATAIIVRVGGVVRFSVELCRPSGVTRIGVETREDLVRLLSPLGDRRVVYSCGVGDRNPIELPGLVLNLARPGRLEVRVHDYFVVSPSVFLVDGEGRFQGVAHTRPEAAENTPVQAAGDRGTDIPWQTEWGRMLRAADEVRVFSSSSANIISAAYPDVTGAIRIRPHRLDALPAPVPVRRGRDLRVGVLGNLSLAKGGGVVCDLARRSAKTVGPEIVAFGRIDPLFSPPLELRILEGYRVEDISLLAVRHSIGAWLMPSICPETFSFATHEALATGLPVVGFNLGAQAEALTAQPNGLVLPLVDGQPDLSLTLSVLRDALRRPAECTNSRAA